MELKVFEHASRKTNKIALTFDDGPNPFWTEKVLDILDKYGIKGSFFLLGQMAERHPDIVKKIFERGHVVGNHTYSHSKEKGDFEKAEEIIFKITGEHTKFIRPPYLDVSLCAGYQPAQSGQAKIINADTYPLDWKRKSGGEIVDFIKTNIQNGSIILLHDGSRHEEEQKLRPVPMFEALPEIIESQKQKFIFCRLDEMDFDNI